MEAKAEKSLPRWFLKPVIWLLVSVGILCRVLLVAWAALAVYFSNLPWFWLRLLLAVAVVGFSIHTLWFSRRRRRWVAFGVMFSAVMLWWVSIRPSHDRPWKPEVAMMPRAIIDGDRARITGYRNFSYRSNTDFTIRYEEREIDLSKVTSVDFFISYWQLGPVGHTFVSFNFEDAEPLCISIEVRPEVGENFAPVASLFKQFELIYVVGNEQDIVGVRASHRSEDIYLYPTRASRANSRKLLEKYLERINELADEPEFYHLLSNSCTVNIVSHARKSAGLERRFDLRYFLNGLVDQYLYSEGLVDNTMAFAELRARSKVDEKAVTAGESPDFSRLIRALSSAPANEDHSQR
jgi:hypothetical protein